MAGLVVLVMKLPVSQLVVLALGQIVVVLVVFTTGVSDDISFFLFQCRAGEADVMSGERRAMNSGTKI